jgi:hypothetical protein
MQFIVLCEYIYESGYLGVLHVFYIIVELSLLAFLTIRIL